MGQLGIVRPPGHLDPPPHQRPARDDVLVTSRGQTTHGERGHQLRWGNQGTLTAVTASTGARSTRALALPAAPPPDAIGAIVMTFVNANTNTGASYQVLFHTALGNAGIAQAVGIVRCNMISSNFSVAQQNVVPLVNNSVIIETTVISALAVNADFTVYLVGHVLA